MIILKFLGLICLIILMIPIGYVILTLVGAFITVNRHFIPATKGVDLFLSTNGMHTDFIVPIQNPLFDWSQFLNQVNFNESQSTPAFLGIGWGDKAVYLDITEWSELTFKMGLNTLLRPTPTILHVTSYTTPPMEALTIKQTKISEQQYLALCLFIKNTFAIDESQQLKLIKGAGYTENDYFFHALGKYHAFNTCNNWVNNGLRNIGVRTALWSPLDKGLFYQFKKIKSTPNRVVKKK